MSKHGRNIGCETCHGGNPATFERMQAHRGMRTPSDPRSPVSRANLPATCGTCHAGPFVAFQDSRHYAMLRAGNQDVPICSTCHGDVAGLVPSPKTVEGICQTCHGARSVAPRDGLAAKAALEIAGLNELRALLDQADAAIARIKDQARRQRLLTQAQQARVPLVEAADAGHRFVYDRLDERLMAARMRTAALLEELANPSVAPPPN